jgi:hypothetical protein
MITAFFLSLRADFASLMGKTMDVTLRQSIAWLIDSASSTVFTRLVREHAGACRIILSSYTTRRAASNADVFVVSIHCFATREFVDHDLSF